MPDQANKTRAAEVARALMRSENISANEAAQRIAPDFDLSAETIRRAALDVVYAKEANGNLHVRVERLEQLVAEMQEALNRAVDLHTRKKSPRPFARRLTADQVRDARQKFRDDPLMTVAELAKMHGISRDSMHALLQGKTYAEVAPELIVKDTRRVKPINLTVEKARDIRRRYRDREASGPELAAEYGVSIGNLYQILDGTSWKGALLPGEEPRIERHHKASRWSR